MNINFLTIGGLTEDIVFFTDEGILIDNKGDLLRQKLLCFEQGAKIGVKDFGYYFGGGSANTAVNLSNLGFNVSCLAKIGDDSRGLKVLDNLKKKGICSEYIERDKKRATGFSFILNNKKDRIIFTYRGSNDNLMIRDKHKKIINKADWVYLTSLPDKYKESLKTIFSCQAKVAWNPGLNQLSEGPEKISSFLKKTEFFMVNKDEALEILKKSKDFKSRSDRFLNNPINAIKILKNFGSKKVILTDGVNGAYFYDGENLHHQKIIRGKKRTDTTGVGDAFNSTVVALMNIFPGDYKKAMFMGVKNTASVVSSSGAQNGLLPLSKILSNKK
jgi:sugar/nucleoside kinase (ribokinase family)